MKILITGVVGFIGFSLAQTFIKNSEKVYGIDNFDNYYSVKYKKKRLNELKKNKNFIFDKIDISNKEDLKNYIKSKNFDYVFHFAAQAGVRYSLVNPEKYVRSNILGFINLIELLKNKKLIKFFYASSSSVYGNTKKFPSKESQKLSPINIYSQSKELNEKIAAYYSTKYNLSCIGLRFFTLYGEWGRPDMFLFKLFRAIEKNKPLELNNYGNHFRDFTYIEDAKNMILSLMKQKTIKNDIFNICSNKPINILKICNFFKKNSLRVKKVPKHPADVFITHGDNNKILKIAKNLKLTDQKIAITKTYKWYIDNKIGKLI
tara:strand:+ start:1056 stop:2009 length:954 start_codon:yes stop_codon:yes gene_type:complete